MIKKMKNKDLNNNNDYSVAGKDGKIFNQKKCKSSFWSSRRTYSNLFGTIVLN